MWTIFGPIQDIYTCALFNWHLWSVSCFWAKTRTDSRAKKNILNCQPSDPNELALPTQKEHYFLRVLSLPLRDWFFSLQGHHPSSCFSAESRHEKLNKKTSAAVASRYTFGALWGLELDVVSSSTPSIRTVQSLLKTLWRGSFWGLLACSRLSPHSATRTRTPPHHFIAPNSKHPKCRNWQNCSI